MTKPAFFLWLLLAPVLTGLTVLPFLLVRDAQSFLGTMFVVATISSTIVSFPISLRLARELV